MARRTTTAQWLPIGLFVVGLVINYFDRVTLSIGNPEIRRDLGLNVAEMGILLSAFSWAYALSQLPAGLLVDKIGPRRLLAVAISLWSLAQALAGFVTSFAPFIAARMALGVCEAPTAPTQARMVANWFPKAQRGLPMGIANIGSSLGSVLSPPILTWLMITWGWRTMFVIMGGCGLVFAAVWYLLYRDPEESDLSEAAKAEIRADNIEPVAPVTIRQWSFLFRHQVTWGMILGNFGAVYVVWLFIAWLPGYFEMEHHVSLLRTGFYAAIPQIFGVLGSLSGGVICDRLAARGMRLIDSRRIPLICGLVGTALFVLPVAFTHSPVMAIIWICAAVFCSNLTSTAAWTLVTAVAPEGYVASIGSMQNCGGYLGASMAPLVTGFIVQETGGFAPAFIVGSVIAALAALCYIFLVREPIAADRVTV
jgi:sugar phosphate permease